MIEHWSNNFPAMLRIEGGGGLPSNMASWSHTLPPPCQCSKQVDISLYHTQCISFPLHTSFCHSPIPGSPGQEAVFPTRKLLLFFPMVFFWFCHCCNTSYILPIPFPICRTSCPRVHACFSWLPSLLGRKVLKRH